MKKRFYSHIISNEPITLELDILELEEEEKKELSEMIEGNLHHAILESILDELSEDDKKKFLEHITGDDHDKVWNHLRDKIEDIDKKIKKTADTMMDELYKDIKDVK